MLSWEQRYEGALLHGYEGQDSLPVCGDVTAERSLTSPRITFLGPTPTPPHLICPKCIVSPSAGNIDIDVDGLIDERGVRFIGSAMRRPNGQWVCLADVQGCLCLVEVKLRLLAKPLPNNPRYDPS